MLVIVCQVRQTLIEAQQLHITRIRVNDEVSGQLDAAGDWAYFSLHVTEVGCRFPNS